MAEAAVAGNGWDEWKNHVLPSLEDIENKQNGFDAQLIVIRERLRGVEVKLTIWGTIITVLLAAMITALVNFIR